MKKPKKPTEVQVGKEITEKDKRSGRFYATPAEQFDSERPIFYFRKSGDYVKGRIIGQSTALHKFYDQPTFLITPWEIVQDGKIVLVEDGQAIEIIAYKNLKRIIDKCELMQSVVRIVLAGKVRSGAGHYQYVWEVWKDTGTFSPIETKQVPKIRKYKKRK